MTSINMKSSVLGIKSQTVAGTPVLPTLAADFVAMQDDVSFDPAFDVLENAEMRASIGKSKSIIGAENPTVSFSHYLRHSGVEGTAPGYSKVLEALFGTQQTNSTERTVQAASTASLIKVSSSGIAASDFPRGMPMLVKSSTRSIRCVHSVSGADITPSFDLPGVPTTGVGLGKGILFSPANQDHKLLTVTRYLGNGGAVEMIADARPTEMSVSVEAGQLINASYSFEGNAYYLNPIEIVTADTYIDWTDDDGTFAAAVTAQVYKDPHELADAIKLAMNTANTGETKSVTYSNSTGAFTISSTGTVLTLKFATGANVANSIANKIGFAASDLSGTAAATGYTGSALTWAAPATPAYDAADPLAAKGHEFMMGDQSDFVSFEVDSLSWTESMTRSVQGSVVAASGRKGSSITARAVTFSAKGELAKYDVSKWHRFREGTTTRLQYSFGSKSGGQWVAGYCGAKYLPTCVITKIKIEDQDGTAVISVEGEGYVNSTGEGETYLGFV